MALRIATALTSFALLTVASPAAGQEASAEAEEPEFVTMSYGETIQSFLTVNDDSLENGRYYKAFVFSGKMGDSITATLSSIDFNANLLLADSTDLIIEDDDNGGGLCNAQVQFELPATGQFVLYATSAAAHETGQFNISVARGHNPPPSDQPCRGFLQVEDTLWVGDSIPANLGPPDGKLGRTFYEVWVLDIPLGETVTIDFLSDDFDARISLYQGFATVRGSNDNGAGKCDARLVFTGSEHPFRIVITTGRPNQEGDYILRVTPGALPIQEESQCNQ